MTKWNQARKPILHALGILLIAGLSFAAGAFIHRGNSHGNVPEDRAHNAAVWTCSMHPQVRRPDPGLCPICAMDLIPLDEEAEQNDVPPNQVSLSERAKTLARIRTTPVRRDEDLTTDIRLLGKIEPKESTYRTVTTWISGRIDTLNVRVTGQRIGKGQIIAKLYSPEIYAAHQDLLVARRQMERLSEGTDSARQSSRAALDSIRERLTLLGVPEQDIERMEQASSPWLQVSIRSPFGGTVLERMATQGAYVTTGAPLYRVVDLSTVWVQLDAYESDLSQIAVKQPVTLEVEAYPDEVFEGKVSFIDPVMDTMRRTTRVRVEVRNTKRKLRPGMFVQAVVQGKTTDSVGRERSLLVPKSAPLFTGKRSIVYVEVRDKERPTYEARVVRLGPLGRGYYPVIAGLRSGERVVVHGAFVLDADLQIRGGASMMAAPDDSQAGPWDGIVELKGIGREVFRPIFSAYLDVQSSLAGDDLAAAHKAAVRLQTATGSTKIKRPQRAIEAFTKVAEALKRNTGRLASSESIEMAREDFEKLSKEIETMLRIFGNPLSEALHQAYCPMAFGNRGATWIQKGNVISNSYFGAAMLKCGEIRAAIEPAGYLPVALLRDDAREKISGATEGHQH
ncbi:MAG: efflux RND transporter periplasmic adaptor subunit [Deltaproteobacteria bacterium]|nr:efflux RND transporter periplasmic adaptor subunit [Deltaproteobacteria bacterium]